MTLSEWKFAQYCKEHPKCNNSACKALFLAGWGAAHNVTEEDKKMCEEWTRRELTLF